MNLCKDRINKHKCELWWYHSQQTHGEVRTFKLWIGKDVESIIWMFRNISVLGKLITGPRSWDGDLQSHKNVVCFLARLRHDFDILGFYRCKHDFQEKYTFMGIFILLLLYSGILMCWEWRYFLVDESHMHYLRLNSICCTL